MTSQIKPDVSPLATRPDTDAPPTPHTEGPEDKRRRWRRSGVTPTVLPYGLVVPALIVVALVSVFPIVFAFRISLFETQFLETTEFIGLANFGDIFLSAAGRADLARTLVYVAASLVVTVSLGLGLASLLNRPLRFRAAFRVLLLLPWVVSQTVAALLWRWLLNPDYGPLPLWIFGEEFDPLANPTTAMVALIVVNVWISYPLATILSLAAIQTIPQDLLEASNVDGASAWQRFWQVKIPLIRPTLAVLAIMLTLLYFNMVTLVLTFTGGGPFSGTQTMSLTAFIESFRFFNIGLGAAYSVTLFLCNVILAAGYVSVLRNDPYA